jgi:hypothetical protein
LAASTHASAPHWQQKLTWQLFALIVEAKIILPTAKQNGFDPF